PADQFDDVENILTRMAHPLTAFPVILFSSVDYWIGAVKAPAGPVLANARRVLKVVEDDLNLTSAEAEDGLCVARDYYTPDGTYMSEGVFSLAVWGVFDTLMPTDD